MVRLFDCTIASCQNAAAIDVGGCERCKSMYCATHVSSALHTCEKTPLDDDAWLAGQTKELVDLSEKINHVALLRHVRELSGGLECRLDDQDPLGRQYMGGMHIHRQLLFEDGTVWLARILRKNYMSFDDELSNRILMSECATLRWLELLDLPTPRLHGYGLRGDPNNEVGVAYMLIDRLPGRPYNPGTASPEQKLEVLHQWANVLCALEKQPFDKVGSLQFDADGEVRIGPIASDRTGTLPCIGPYENANEYYSSWAKAYIELIIDGQLFSSYPVDAYLMLKHMEEQVQAGHWLRKWQDLHSGPFFLKHMDDKGDHILIDDNFQITGIIDWTFARTVPAYEAFGPSLMSANTTDLFNGNPGLSQEDKALEQEIRHRGALHCYFELDGMRRFLFGPGIGLGLTKHEAFNVFRALVATFEGVVPEQEEWRENNINKWMNDSRLLGLCQSSSEGTLLHRNGINMSATKPPRFATCSRANCGRPSVRGQSCSSCRNHLCAIHLRPRYHKCLSSRYLDNTAWEKGINTEVEALLAQVNVPELVRVASSLRETRPCKFLPGQHIGDEAMMGCANYHGWIVFDDGIKWLVRIPRTTDFSDVPTDLTEYLVESEYATLKVLENLGVPAPRAHGYGLASDPNNSVGVSYILEDAMPGKPFYAYQATDEQKLRVYEQYADVLIKMSQFTSTQACSLVPRNGGTQEGAIASNRFLALGKYGPFPSSLEYFTSIAELHLDLIADGQLYPEYPKEAFLFYRLLRDRASPMLAATTTPSRTGTEAFFLKHVDDKGDHILVDENYTITAIIDWQFARFVPACEAFGPSLVTADLSNLYNPRGSSAGLSVDDKFLAECFARKGRKDLEELVGGNELVRRFHFGLASGLRRDEVLGMIGAVISMLEDDGKTLSEVELSEWLERNWKQALVHGDVRRCEKIEKLVADIENEK
ncbi:hypothetical protein F4860DRAFT_68268 [Xylaria cubensis]|nr:hypothetical protein F4860DRAFT_68268 [Xylaria cubensis]